MFNEQILNPIISNCARYKDKEALKLVDERLRQMLDDTSEFVGMLRNQEKP